MFFIVLSMFLAIVDTSYEKVREQLERKAHEPKHQFLEDFSWLCTLPSRAVGAVWAKFIRCLWDAEKLSPLQEEEDEEIDPDKAKSGTGEELKDEEDAETADALSEADPLVAAAELYRNALERVEQMAEVQDQLEQFLEGIEPRVLAITQMK